MKINWIYTEELMSRMNINIENQNYNINFFTRDINICFQKWFSMGLQFDDGFISDEWKIYIDNKKEFQLAFESFYKRMFGI